MSVHCGWLRVAEGPAWAFADPPDASSFGVFFFFGICCQTFAPHGHPHRPWITQEPPPPPPPCLDHPQHDGCRGNRRKQGPNSQGGVAVRLAVTLLPATKTLSVTGESSTKATDTEATDENMQRMLSNGAQMPVHTFIKFSFGERDWHCKLRLQPAPFQSLLWFFLHVFVILWLFRSIW